MPDIRYFEKIVRDTGFGFDILEKTYHLIKIMQFIFSQSDLKKNLTLKGGTALNFIYLDIPRLSIDIDLNLTDGSVDSKVEQMAEEIFVKIKAGGSKLGYQVEDAASTVIWQRKILKYQTLRGPMDFIKVELDKIERIPLMDRIVQRIINPFPEFNEVYVSSYSLEELTAMKVKSLFDRAHPRDLFDLYKISRVISEEAELIDLVVVYSCFTLTGFGLSELLEKTNLITEDSFTREVVPFLRAGEKMDLRLIKTVVVDFLKAIYSKQDKRHKEFLNDFRAGDLRLDLLPTGLTDKVRNHPSIPFWLEAR